VGFVFLDLMFYVYVLYLFVCSFVLFLLVIVLSVLLRYTDSDYLPLVSSNSSWRNEIIKWYLLFTFSRNNGKTTSIMFNWNVSSFEMFARHLFFTYVSRWNWWKMYYFQRHIYVVVEICWPSLFKLSFHNSKKINKKRWSKTKQRQKSEIKQTKKKQNKRKKKITIKQKNKKQNTPER
jgi:hypothetical protein